MGKHIKIRRRSLNCLHCGAAFETGSSIQDMCSPECRVASLYATFAGVDGCWVWPKSRNPKTGYGHFSTWKDGKRVILTAHRVSYAVTHGAVPDGASVLHRCDNRPCFNPAHLFVGTQKENMHDMWRKGRGNPPGLFGARHPFAKVNEDDVRSIRASSLTLRELGALYGLSQSALSGIRRRRTWTHVT